MKKMKMVWGMLKYNFKTLVAFECLFKLVTLFFFTPFFLKIFNWIMKVTGYSYLTFENIFTFLFHPTTLFLLLILILLMMIYTMFDITTIIIILDQSYQKKKIHLKDAVFISLKKCKTLLHIQNLPLAFLVLFLLPFLNLGSFSSLITTIRIPEFILDFIAGNGALLSLFMIVMFFFMLLFLRWMYAIHYYILEDVSFKKARVCSKNLGKGHYFRDFFFFFSVQFLIVFFYFLFLFLGILLIAFLNELFSKILLVKTVMTTVVWVFIAISFFIVTLLAMPISYAEISVLYYLRKMKKKEPIKNYKVSSSKTKTYHGYSKFFIPLCLLMILFGSIYTYGIYTGKYHLNFKIRREIEVTAHRGDSKHYPENTMSAFKGAKKLGADWIELDVQMTRDGEIIVIHDTSLQRTTGLHKNTWELSYDEIRKLDAGSFFDEKYKDERIPLLKEVLLYAKENHIKLNIELKPTGHEKDFEKTVIDLIRETKFEENCVITSQVYEVLQNVKRYNTNIQTVYVMSLAYGDITSLVDADSFSIEATSVTPSLVKRIHKEGKQLYAWTVNTEENIRRMIDLNVDNIITDQVSFTKDIIYSSKTSDLISEYVKLVEELFK